MPSNYSFFWWVYTRICIVLYKSLVYIIILWFKKIPESLFSVFPWTTTFLWHLFPCRVAISVWSSTGACGTDLPPPPFFKLSVYKFIFNKISLLFHLFFLILTCSCHYSYNLMLTTTCMCRPYIDGCAHALMSRRKIFTSSYYYKFLQFFGILDSTGVSNVLSYLFGFLDL